MNWPFIRITLERERSNSGLMGDEATFRGLTTEWEVESGDSTG